MFCMNLDEARGIAVELSLPPSRENIRRVVRAHDLINRDHVRHWFTTGKNRVYKVKSQHTDETYTVGVNGSFPVCNCPDDVRVCKHAIAVMLNEEREAEEAMIAFWEASEADRFACDGYELY